MPRIELIYEEIPGEDQPVPCGIGICMEQATHYVSRRGRTVVAETCRQHAIQEESVATRQRAGGK
jgi:hypothetical protein